MGQTPRLDEVIEDAINERLEDFWTAIPARVKSYDASTQTATISILISNKVEDGSGQKRWYKPTIHNVPVMFPGNSGTVDADSYSITYPMHKLSNGLYIVSTWPTDGWRANGTEVDLNRAGGSTNHLSSGFLIPAETRKPYQNVPSDAMVLSGKSILIGGSTGTQPTIMATTYRNAEDTMLGALSTFLTALNAYAVGIQTVVDPAEILTPILSTAINVVKSAISTFTSNDPNYVTTRTEVK